MKKKRKQRLLIAVSAFLFIAAGCGQKAEENQEIPQNAATSEEYSYKEQRKESYDFEAESIAGLYRDIYDRRWQCGIHVLLNGWHGSISGCRFFSAATAGRNGHSITAAGSFLSAPAVQEN